MLHIPEQTKQKAYTHYAQDMPSLFRALEEWGGLRRRGNHTLFDVLSLVHSCTTAILHYNHAAFHALLHHGTSLATECSMIGNINQEV